METSYQIAENLISSSPSTRYQGSKRRVLPWLYESFKQLKFETALDAFGGTASVSYLLKLMGKTVTFNDMLLSNYQTGLALIENNTVTLEERDLDFVLCDNGFKYTSFIQQTFKGIYYTDEENNWLDRVSFNIQMLSLQYTGDTLQKKRALAYHSLFQACLCKRPFNLFHRKNLYLRTAEVKRSFGNKKMWDAEFSYLFTRFAREVSTKVFSNGKANLAMCQDILRLADREYDLVYLDPPYLRLGANHPIDYYSLYHFLEGLCDYEHWSSSIDWTRENRSLLQRKNEWQAHPLEENFVRIFEKFRNSILVISYGKPGTPSIETIVQLLGRFKNHISTAEQPYAYRLNRNNQSGLHEVLIVGW